MPPIPADVLVGRIASIEKGGELQRESHAKQGFGLKFTDYHWAFRTWYQRLILPSAQRFEGVFAINSLKPNDIVVALASYYDGGKPHNYRIDSVAKLTCQNNKLILQKPLVIPSVGIDNSNDVGLVKITQGFWMALSTTTKPIIWQNYSKNTQLVPL